MRFFKRGSLEIIAEILRSLSSENLIKTHLTFKCKLDSRAVAKYLSVLLINNLIIKLDGDSNLFMITKKGREFLIQYDKLMNLIDDGRNSNLEKPNFNMGFHADSMKKLLKKQLEHQNQKN